MAEQGEATQPMSLAASTVAKGCTLDRYEILSQIGNGGMADVYRARDGLLGREVALKLLRGGSPSESDRARFLAEGRILAGLTHPGLITLLDIGADDEQPFLAMELVEGRTLAGPLDLADVADLGRQLAEALAYTHQHGVVHRDVKPGNVLLDDDGRVRLADFGIARLLGDTVHLTDPGKTIGTAAYVAPEQVRGDPVDTPADVYALGLVLIEAITGEPVYTGPPMEAAVARLHCPPSIPEGLLPGWQRLLSAMTSSDPALRPSAAAVAINLASLASDGDVLAPTTSQPTVGKPARLGWLSTKALAAVTLVLVLSLGALLPHPGHEPAVVGSEVPQVAQRLQGALEDLHLAVADLGNVSGTRFQLGLIDRALVERRYDTAAVHLRSLMSLVGDADRRGLVDQLRARNLVTAARQLLALLSITPGPTPSDQARPTPQAQLSPAPGGPTSGNDHVPGHGPRQHHGHGKPN